MAINKFTDRAAIEIATEIRKNLALDNKKPLAERWIEKDALAQVILLAEERVAAKRQEDETKVSV